MTDLLPAFAETRQRFLDLVADVRPELHRYCARMTGSVFDGEDVLQDTLAKAYYALAEMESAPPLRPWLFRIAHNTAIDFGRRYEQRHVEPVADVPDGEGSLDEPPDGERVEAALSVFAALPPLQRSALALKDVLGFSLEETATIMNTSVEAVKAALVRARANVVVARARPATPPPITDLARLRRYADLFNAHDWDSLRTLFGEETRLDLASRVQRRGRRAAEYFSRYEDALVRETLRAEVGWVDGVLVLGIHRPVHAPTPAYFVRIAWRGDVVDLVRDYRYVPYIAQSTRFVRASSSVSSTG